MLGACPDNLCTSFPQNLWKTHKSPMFIKICSTLLCLLILSSCSYFKGSKKQDVPGQEPKASETTGKGETQPAQPPQTGTDRKVTDSAKETSKGKLAVDNAIIDMTEVEVKKKYGEPSVVSKMPDNRTLWTYYPSWKILPDNKGTIYIEFENGKAVKIIKAR
jgi:hypothetical protein